MLFRSVAVESLVNTVAFGRFIQPLFVICLILLVFLGFEGVLRMMQAYLAELIQQRLFVRVVADLAYRLPRVRQSAYDEHHGPEMMNRFFDVMTIQKSAALLVLDGIALVLQVSIGLILLAFYHPLLLTLDLFLVAALGFMVVFLGHGAVATSIAESKAKYAVASWLEELARVPTLFRNADGPRRALIRADQLALGYVDARRRHFRVLLRQIAFALGLQAVSGSLLLGLGGWLVMQGQLTLGQLVAAELVLAVIVGSLTKLGKQLESFYDLLTAVDKVGHLFDLPMERAVGEIHMDGQDGATVSLRDASLTLQGATVIEKANLEVAAGELVALVGPAGSGKSMLLDLMHGLREPSHGYVMVDDVDIRSLQPAALRRHVTLVRGFEIVVGSIGENVHLDRDGVTGRNIREALAEVGLLEEIMALPEGLNTELLPSGSPLSESQVDRKSTRLNSSHIPLSRMPSSA